jgi:glycosyltransferase involved in cell wall biosynthesis
MRVAHFVHRYPPALGGSEAYFARLSRYLAARGDEVTVFTTTAYDLEAFWTRRGRCLPAGETVEDGVAVRRYPLTQIWGQRYVLKVLSMAPQRTWQALTAPCNPLAAGMWRDAGRTGRAFDVVHATPFPYGWPLACGRRLAQRLSVPFVLTPFLHTGDRDDPRDRTRRGYTKPHLLALARTAARIFVQTEGERVAFKGLGFPEERLVLQGMGLDRESCTGGDRRAVRAAWGVGDEAVIGHLANNSREKGTVDLLAAAGHAWDEGARFKLVLAGPAMPNFERFWRGYEYTDRVRRLGVLDDRQKRDFFAGIDVFALPSRTDSFGIVLLEAWANGTPNVGYRAGGVADVIRDEVDGLLVRCGDVDGLSRALRRLAEDAGLRQRLGAAGLERTRREFRWDEKLQLVGTVYDELAVGRGPT